MKKSLKILYIILSVFVGLVIVAAVAINLFADSALKIGIETAGTKALKVAVSVDDVKLSIVGGSLGLKNLVIDNPEGYQHKRLLELQNAEVKVDTGSLLSNTVNIKEIKLDGVNVVLEQRGVSGNNLQDILNSLLAGEEKKEAEPSGKKLHIDELEISDVTVNVKLLPIHGKADTVTLKLSPIKMTDLGGDNKLDTAGLANKVLLAIAGGIAEQGLGVLPADMVNTMQSTLSKTMDIGKDALKSGGDIGKKVLEGGKDAGKGITEGLKGLFKPKEDQNN